MSKDFLNFINQLMEANPELTKQLMTESIEADWNNLLASSIKPDLTKNGATVLKALQEHFMTEPFKASDVANVMNIAARGVSGSLRKLVTDGFCDKIGKEPITYKLTEKGQNYKINEGENE